MLSWLRQRTYVLTVVKVVAKQATTSRNKPDVDDVAIYSANIRLKYIDDLSIILQLRIEFTISRPVKQTGRIL